MQRVYLVPSGPDVESLAALLGAVPHLEAPSEIQVGYLDTFDWRLAQQGLTLAIETDGQGRSLHLRGDDENPPYSLPITRQVRFAHELPPGYLRDRLTPILEVRALVPMGAGRVRRRRGRLDDDAGNALAHLDIDRLLVMDREGNSFGEPHTVVTVQWTTGAGNLVETLDSLLAETGASELGPLAELSLTAEAMGRRPGDYSSKPRLALRPEQSADDALRTILRDLLETLRANVDGVLADTDVEFLHDLRVATRRTRSALTQIKGVLPEGEKLARFRDEFRWLGAITGPLRDLDVYLLEMAGYRAALGAASRDLDPLERLLRRDRRNALRRVRRGLRSKRFQRLLEDWASFLDSPESDPSSTPRGARPILEVSSHRIRKAHRRIIKRGAELGHDPPAEDLHRLRIDAKKLRYLLEFFVSLYPADRTEPLVKELKKLQDTLGGFNDMAVQQEHLLELARQMVAEGDPQAETLLAMGRLAANLERRQERFHDAFAGRFAEFASERSRDGYNALFGDVQAP